MKHSFNVEVAAFAGVHAAVIFDNLAYWIRRNRITGRNERRGVYWTYGTHKDLAAQFDYLSEKQVRTALNKLIAGGYIEAGRFNRHKYDRTSWYTLTPAGERLAYGEPEEKPKEAETEAPADGPIPDLKPYIKSDDSIHARARALKAKLGQK